MKNVLTDKCWIVEVMGLNDSDDPRYHGWRVEQVIQATGLEVVGMLCNTEEGERLRVRCDKPSNWTVPQLLQAAAEAVTRASNKYSRVC